jgi:hypothetical protein
LTGNSTFLWIDLIGSTTRPASHADVLATSALTVPITNAPSASEPPQDTLKELVPSDIAQHALPPLPPPHPHHHPVPPIALHNLAEVALDFFVPLEDLPHLIVPALLLSILPSSVTPHPQTTITTKRTFTMVKRTPTCAANTPGQGLTTKAWVGDSKATRGVMLRLSLEFSLCLFSLSFCFAYRLYFVFALYHRSPVISCLVPHRR